MPLSLGTLMLTGCATEPGARFSGVSEQKVLARIQHYCAGYSVGDYSLGTLLQKNDAFRALTLTLYRGEMSNDEYVDKVFSSYPAADGNVPATGCVIAQFNQCLAGDCEIKKASPNKAVSPAAGKHVAMPVAEGSEMSVSPELQAEL
ncbi:hypothetical protein [Thiorhodovibrio frisius]|uniref:hypothetical protein n=1 Tax=Thiorhodovibrio frisius TaxID=631362 RepID=UPI000311863A|nr:hypothetical protein [Thiorhodovibrio frisius]